MGPFCHCHADLFLARGWRHRMVHFLIILFGVCCGCCCSSSSGVDTGAADGRFAAIFEPGHTERIEATDGKEFEDKLKQAGLQVLALPLPGPRPMQMLHITA